MTSVVPAAVAEAAAEQITGQDVELRFHTSDPGTDGSNEVTGLDPVTVEDTDWAAFVDDATTMARGGRVASNTSEIDLGVATADETINFVTVWKESDGDGDGAGTFDVWLMTIALDEGVSYQTGNEVAIAAGALQIFGAGAA